MLAPTLALAASAATCPPPDPAACPPPDGVASRVVLLGDSGLGDTWPGGVPSPCGRDPVLALAGTCAAAVPERAVVVLGDASYGKRTVGAAVGAILGGRSAYGGLPRCPGGCEQVAATGVGRLEQRQWLDELDIARDAGVPVWIVPGNHDWARGQAGLRRADALTRAYAAVHDVDTRLLPAGELSCRADPRVDAEDVGEITVVAVDTAWALRCPAAHPALGEAVWARVAAAQARGQRVIVASHHPAVSHGTHGTSRRYRQDLRSRAYERFVADVFGPEAPAVDDARVLLAAGHDHHLEIAAPTPGVHGVVQVVSGAGTLPMAHPDAWGGCDPGDAALALSRGAGFVVVDLGADGRWSARLVDVATPGTCDTALDAARGACRTAPIPACPPRDFPPGREVR
ncbi:MAG: metallophosphoesterase [Myxococcota bacterium]